MVKNDLKGILKTFRHPNFTYAAQRLSHYEKGQVKTLTTAFVKNV